jgi:hypothetical protein
LHGDGAFAWKTCTFLRREKIRGDPWRTFGTAARQERKLQVFAIDGRATLRLDGAARCRAGHRSTNFLRSHLVRRARVRCATMLI